MRKLLFILLALAGCLLFSESRESLCTVRTAPVAELSGGNASADQWLCERICNSDLNQPRVLREAEASPAAPMFQRGGLHMAADRKSTRLNSSHVSESRMPSSA